MNKFPRLALTPAALALETQTSLTALVTAGVCVGQLALWAAADLPYPAGMHGYQHAVPTRIYSYDGQLIALLALEDERWVPLAEIAASLQQAVLASEDPRFFERPIPTAAAATRCAFKSALNLDAGIGVSPLTIRAARTFYTFPSLQSGRKAAEARSVLQLDGERGRVLEILFNQGYFGNGAYGVQSASELYFGKQPIDLSLAESALLVAVLGAPGACDPLARPDAARWRTLEILRRMRDLEVLAPIDYADAVSECLIADHKARLPRQARLVASYPGFTRLALQELTRRYTPEQLFRDGLTVFTTLDTTTQARAERAVTAPAVCLENGSGAIRSLVGPGPRQVDDLTLPGARLQISYVSGPLEEGGPLVSLARPGEDGGPMEALLAALQPRRLELTPEDGSRLANRPLEIASAMWVVANRGTYVEPHSVALVLNRGGAVVADLRRDKVRNQVMKPSAARLLRKLLSCVALASRGLELGTSERVEAMINGFGQPLGDSAFVGSSARYTVAVCGGKHQPARSRGSLRPLPLPAGYRRAVA